MGFNFTEEKFQAVKKFATDFNIKSMITDLDAMIPFFDYSKNSTLHSGERIAAQSFHPLAVNSFSKEGICVFDMSNYDQQTQQINIKGQTLFASETQHQQILIDGCGAIKMDAWGFLYLTKEQFEYNQSILLEKNRSIEFRDEFERIYKLYELNNRFNEAKTNLSSYGLEWALDQWSQPIFPPHKPQNTSDQIYMSGFVSASYSAFHHGVEVTPANIIPDTKRIEVCNHQFILSEDQLADLREDGIAFVFEKGGFTFFRNKKQAEEEEKYQADFALYLKFSKALSDADDYINNEKIALKSQAQHAVFEKLPFPYFVAIKVNWRLLTENSLGDGARRNTTPHIVVGKELTGRLKRCEGEYLCGGDSSMGFPTEKEDALFIEGTQGRFKLVVTCKQCIKIAERILKKGVLK